MAMFLTKQMTLLHNFTVNKPHKVTCEFLHLLLFAYTVRTSQMVEFSILELTEKHSHTTKIACLMPATQLHNVITHRMRDPASLIHSVVISGLTDLISRTHFVE